MNRGQIGSGIPRAVLNRPGGEQANPDSRTLEAK